MKLTALFSSLFLTTFAAGEAIHLVNCNGGPQPISMVAYYADDHNPTQPPSDNVCLMSYGPYFYWETGIYEYCKFPTGVEFKFNIEVVAQAPGVGDYSDVGCVFGSE
ncbi:hypothetical protein VFPFJ_11086 [Purpureocillium lilacinum]|uniref:AA1-like domain-containing protein n=1 Tax=Purpureocillium lilacinum TaxID=33203 RepID=A0A179GZ62_PURLI|nr:hypothetical protein VFPFJ_11086 [Purpureocillium lilacinum]OAQ69584.1 hypothetical protein VFPFJ_11086 [Purpureocillium lilacinum]OAQ82531.1 hypothetical protein VFPBJ_05116 [Purpureocillium lilacinum]